MIGPSLVLIVISFVFFLASIFIIKPAVIAILVAVVPLLASLFFLLIFERLFGDKEVKVEFMGGVYSFMLFIASLLRNVFAFFTISSLYALFVIAPLANLAKIDISREYLNVNYSIHQKPQSFYSYVETLDPKGEKKLPFQMYLYLAVIHLFADIYTNLKSDLKISYTPGDEIRALFARFAPEKYIQTLYLVNGSFLKENLKAHYPIDPQKDYYIYLLYPYQSDSSSSEKKTDKNKEKKQEEKRPIRLQVFSPIREFNPSWSAVWYLGSRKNLLKHYQDNNTYINFNLSLLTEKDIIIPIEHLKNPEKFLNNLPTTSKKITAVIPSVYYRGIITIVLIFVYIILLNGFYTVYIIKERKHKKDLISMIEELKKVLTKVKVKRAMPRERRKKLM